MFNAENQKFDLAPLVRFRHDGSVMTSREAERLNNIEAKEGRFGGVLERPMKAPLTRSFPGKTKRPTIEMLAASRADKQHRVAMKLKNAKKKGAGAPFPVDKERKGKREKQEASRSQNKLSLKLAIP